MIAYVRKSETYADLACGFQIGTSTVYRYLREALTLLAAMAPTLDQAIEVASRKAFVILDGALLWPFPSGGVASTGHRPLPAAVGQPSRRQRRARPPTRTGRTGQR